MDELEENCSLLASKDSAINKLEEKLRTNESSSERVKELEREYSELKAA